jgi:phage tail sheath protein FI
VSLENGSDDLQGIDASVVQSAIAALARHPLPSLVAIPDLMLPFVHADAGCPRIPEFDARRPFPEAAPPPRAEPELWPSEPAPEDALPSYGPSVELLQDELIQAIWTTREQMAEKIVLLDPPPGADPGEIIRRAGHIRDRFDADDAGFRPASTGAMFYPWIRVLDPAAGRRGTALVPPSGYVAGIMARTSREGGAGARFANEPIVGAVACERALSDDERGELNAARVSALHAVAGRGPSVFGARTLSAQRRPDVFIPAARVLAFVRRALRILGETLVFEPNDALLTQRIRVGADRVLRELLRSGAFVGRSPREAYAVRCDASTTPPEEIARGRVIAEVDVALAVPLEFITLRVAFARDGSNVLDGVPRERG